MTTVNTETMSVNEQIDNMDLNSRFEGIGIKLLMNMVVFYRRVQKESIVDYINKLENFRLKN